MKDGGDNEAISGLRKAKRQKEKEKKKLYLLLRMLIKRRRIYDFAAYTSRASKPRSDRLVTGSVRRFTPSLLICRSTCLFSVPTV